MPVSTYSPDGAAVDAAVAKLLYPLVYYSVRSHRLIQTAIGDILDRFLHYCLLYTGRSPVGRRRVRILSWPLPVRSSLYFLTVTEY